MIFDDDIGFWMVKFEFQKSKITKAFRRFCSTMGKPSFLLLHTMYAISFHSNTDSLLEYTKG
jgi:hypothetical protein